ncbi:MAG: tetratricopeptide repeat protein [Thermoanaerobaculia bacterium]
MQSTVRLLFVLSLAAVLLAVAAAPAAAQAWKGKGRLQGKIFDPEGKPYAGARITLHLPDNPELGPEPFTSDAKGRWSYLGLTGGLWTILIVTEEYLLSVGTLKVNESGGPGKPVIIELEAPSPEQVQNTAMLQIERGNELFKAGSYGEARASYELAMETVDDGDKPAVLRGIAQTYRFEEQNDKALEIFQQALELDPGDVATLKLVVDVLLAEGRNTEAEPYLARLPASEKLDVASRLNMGIELYNGDEIDPALKHFDQAIADFPDEPDGYYYRGLCLLGKEQNADALVAFKKFLEIAPDSPRSAEAQQFVEYLESQ